LANNIAHFVGVWTVRYVAGAEPWLQAGWQLFLGTGTAGDPAPYLGGDGNPCLGVTVKDDKGDVQLTGGGGAQPIALMFLDGELRWNGFHEGKPLRLYLSLATGEAPGGVPFAFLYGSTVWGDPDQAGVWGADTRPPGGG